MSAHIQIGGKWKGVKNLGWLLRHKGDVSGFTIEKIGSEANFTAHLQGNDTFSCHFASFEVAKLFIDRPSFKNLPRKFI